MFLMPPRIPENNDNWRNFETSFGDSYRAVQELYPSGLTRRLQRHNSYADVALTLVNPATEIAYFMLHHDNRETNAGFLQITHTHVNFNDIPLPLTGIIDEENAISRNANTHIHQLNIHLVKTGGQRISELNKEAEIKPLSVALQRSGQHRIRVFARHERFVDVYTNVWTWDIYYKLMAFLPQLFPKVYAKTTVETKEVLLALATKNYEKFVESANAWFKKYEPDKEKELEELKTFFEFSWKKQKDDINQRITQGLKNIEDYYNEITARYKELDKLYITRNGLESKDTTYLEQLEDLLTFLKKNKAIKKYAFSRSKLNLIIETPLKYTDSKIINDLYIRGGSYSDNVRQLLKEVFIDETYNIWAYMTICLDLENYETRTNGTAPSNCIPHPHIMSHHCWGNNRSIIKKALNNNDIQLAVAQSIATCLNLNAVDSTVVGSMINNITNLSRNIPAIENVETGQRMTYAEYVTLKEKESEAQNETVKTDE